MVLLFAVLAPLAARFVQMAVSRQREFLSDATSVQLTRDPTGLILVLQKLLDSSIHPLYHLSAGQKIITEIALFCLHKRGIFPLRLIIFINQRSANALIKIFMF